MSLEGRITAPGKGIAHPATRGSTPDRSVKTVTKKYTVVGPHAVSGVKTGNDVMLTLTVAQEQHLIQAGHIQVSTR